MRIYIIGRYSANHPREVLKNVNRAIDIGIELIKKGHAVFIPHLSHYIHLRPYCPFEYEEYLRNDIEWLKVSDPVFFINQSKGANRELEIAKSLGLRIYTNLGDVKKNE